MRVISGKYKGRKLKEFDLNSTKPTLDSVKESIFNLIQFDIFEKTVLDLFAGTGSLGIEALSRGAKEAIFVDENPQAIKLINANLHDIHEPHAVIKSDYLKFLTSTDAVFDLVFLDPPFASDYGTRAIDYLVTHKKLSAGGIIIFETSADKVCDFSEYNLAVDRRVYGTVAVYKLTLNED